jgi:hypothetical protein
LGTAFAVGERVAVTAFHCLRGLGLKRTEDTVRVGLRFLEPDGSLAVSVVPARSATFDENADWAILLLDSRVPTSSTVLGLRHQVDLHAKCRALGFAREVPEATVLPAVATVAGTEGSVGGGRVLQLQAEAPAGGLSIKGLSGAPVLIGTPEQAAGLVRRQHVSPYDRSTPLGGVVFACPATLFAAAVELYIRAGLDARGFEVDLLREQATRGSVEHSTMLGRMLRERGEDAQAEAWLRFAAEAGDASAAFNLGLLMEKLDNRSEAMVWFRRAASRGDVMAAATFGLRLRDQGRNDAALPWLEAAAEGGDPMGAHTLARVLEERGDPRAIEWERFAAEAGDTLAAHELERMTQL